MCGGESVSKLNEILERYKNEKQFCTPNGFLKTGGKYYILEAKNWPLWTEGKKPFDQMRDVLFSTPLILATKAIHRTKEYDIHEVLFSWWSKPKVKSLY